MKRLLALGVLAGAMGLSVVGCTDPIPALQNKMGNMPQVVVSDYWLQSQIRVDNIVPERLGAGQLRVTGQVRNLWDQTLSIDYQVWYFDARGVQVDNPIGWQHLTVAPRGAGRFEPPPSMSGAAEQFQIHIRKAE